MAPEPIPPKREFKESDFIGGTLTPDYMPSGMGYGVEVLKRIPPFTLQSVEFMLTDDKVCQGLDILKGLLTTNAKFDVVCSNEKVRQFVMNQYDRFFLNSAYRCLKALEWGFACGEISYREDTEQPNEANPGEAFVSFDIIKDFASVDCRPQVLKAKIVGCNIKPSGFWGHPTHETYIGAPRFLWHVYGRQHNPFFGRSRIRPSWPHFLKKWGEDGYNALELLYFKKYAFPGLMIGINAATGNFPGLNADQVQSFKDKIRNVFDKLRSGGNVTYPMYFDSQGNPLVKVEPVPFGTNPAPMLEWGDKIDRAIFNGLGIPPEVTQAQVSGLGQGGRDVAMTACLVTLQDALNCLVADFDVCCVRPMVEWNYGPNIQYDVIPHKLAETQSAMDGGQETPPGINPTDETALDENGQPTEQPPGDQQQGEPPTAFSILPGGYIQETTINRDKWGRVDSQTTKVYKNAKSRKTG